MTETTVDLCVEPSLWWEGWESGLDPGGSRVGAGDEISYHFLHCGLSMLLNHREIKPQLSHAVKWTSE